MTLNLNDKQGSVLSKSHIQIKLSATSPFNQIKHIKSVTENMSHHMLSSNTLANYLKKSKFLGPCPTEG